MGIVVKNLTKTYGEHKAVDNISFETNRGEILGFLGPNGAGKTTTMKTATCYITPTTGSVTVEGYDVVKSPLEVRKHIGYLPEHNPLYLDMYIHEYLRFVAGIHKIRKPRQKVQKIVGMVGLQKEEHKKIGMLSKGYRQRVGLAQALIHDPSVLILDEPTTGLDPNQIGEIRDLIKEVSQNKTVMLSTHIMQEVQALCDRVIIINKGQLVTDSNVDALKKQSDSINILVEFIDYTPKTWLKNIPSVFEVVQKKEGLYLLKAQEDVRAEIFREAVQKGETIIGLHQEQISLEQVFTTLTK
ncbi:gliding motility-associated ABC transporter ATP-binding subunit GldA [Algivirga pacifica]|uniref:Gliding motility-associated ABC transporter ATP-binding subunit GldA n=1 Tax=Algivirga pacifica TaxID=1162670 RepID=A0ABP9DDG0_9BACT